MRLDGSGSYYESRELVPHDMLADLDKAKIVITNYHAFKLRERTDLSKGTRAALWKVGGTNQCRRWKPKGR